MNFLKSIIVGSFAFFALSASAQTGTNPVTAQYSQESINQLATELSLSPEQVSQIQDLNEMVIVKIEAIQNNTQMDDAKKKEFIQGNREDHKRVMATILTPEQFTAYENLLKAKASSRTEKRMQIQDVKKTN
jgi:hypothetical protein